MMGLWLEPGPCSGGWGRKPRPPPVPLRAYAPLVAASIMLVASVTTANNAMENFQGNGAIRMRIVGAEVSRLNSGGQVRE